MKPNKLLAVILLTAAITQAHAAPYFRLESAPIFADNAGGANQVIGPFATAYQEYFPTPTTTLSITNTGPVPDGTPLNPGLPYGFNYFVKTQIGDFSIPGTRQMVVNLEGASVGGQGGMIDVLSNMLAAEAAQPEPPGKIYYSGLTRFGVYDIPFPSAPTVLTNSRLQRRILADNHDPATQNLTTGWANVEQGDGSLASLSTTFDASGLDVVFDVYGGLYPYLALEDSAVRLVTIYEGPDPAAGGDGGGGSSVPEPASLALLAASLVGIGFSRRRRPQF